MDHSTCVLTICSAFALLPTRTSGGICITPRSRARSAPRRCRRRRADPLPRAEGDAAEGDGHVALSPAVLRALPRVGGERLHADRDRRERPGVADGAVHHDAGPAVAGAERGELIAEERDPERSAAVDHEDAARARLLQRTAHEDVVLVDLDGDDRAGEARGPAEVAKDGGDDADGVAVRVAEVGGGGGHGAELTADPSACTAGDVGSGISRLRARRRRRSARLVRRYGPRRLRAPRAPPRAPRRRRPLRARWRRRELRRRRRGGRRRGAAARRTRRAARGARSPRSPGPPVGRAALEGLPELLGRDPRAPVGALCRLPPEGAQRTDALVRRPGAAEGRGVGVRSGGRRGLGLLGSRATISCRSTIFWPRKTSITRISPVVSANSETRVPPGGGLDVGDLVIGHEPGAPHAHERDAVGAHQQAGPERPPAKAPSPRPNISVDVLIAPPKSQPTPPAKTPQRSATARTPRSGRRPGAGAGSTPPTGWGRARAHASEQRRGHRPEHAARSQDDDGARGAGWGPSRRRERRMQKRRRGAGGPKLRRRAGDRRAPRRGRAPPASPIGRGTSGAKNCRGRGTHNTPAT